MVVVCGSSSCHAKWFMENKQNDINGVIIRNLSECESKRDRVLQTNIVALESTHMTQPAVAVWCEKKVVRPRHFLSSNFNIKWFDPTKLTMVGFGWCIPTVSCGQRIKNHWNATPRTIFHSCCTADISLTAGTNTLIQGKLDSGNGGVLSLLFTLRSSRCRCLARFYHHRLISTPLQQK